MLFVTWLTVVVVGVGVGEYYNCKHPRIDESYSSEGFFCNWEDRDFYVENGKWILTESDSTDNCYEKKWREIYWEKRKK